MSDQPTGGAPTPGAAPAASAPTAASQGNSFNPHTTITSQVPKNASYPTQEQMDARRAMEARTLAAPKPGAAPATPEPAAAPEVDEAGLPRHATQPRDEKGRWTAEEIQAAADEGYDVEGLEPGMEHPDEEPEEPPKPTFRIKVHGEEMEVDYETAKAELEMNFGAKKLFSQVDQERRKLEAALASNDPETYMRARGIDPEAFAVQYLNRQVQLGTMSKEERALYERQQALEQREQQLHAEEQQRAQAQRQAQDAATLRMLSEQLPVQLEAAGLPTDGTALSLILPHLRDAEAAGVDITPEIVQRAAQLARQSLDVGVVRTVRGLRGPQLLSVLGPEVLQEVRRMDLEAARARKARPPAVREAPQAAPAIPQKRPVMTEAEFKEYQRRRGL